LVGRGENVGSIELGGHGAAAAADHLEAAEQKRGSEGSFDDHDDAT